LAACLSFGRSEWLVQCNFRSSPFGVVMTKKITTRAAGFGRRRHCAAAEGFGRNYAVWDLSFRDPPRQVFQRFLYLIDQYQTLVTGVQQRKPAINCNEFAADFFD